MKQQSEKKLIVRGKKRIARNVLYVCTCIVYGAMHYDKNVTEGLIHKVYLHCILYTQLDNDDDGVYICSYASMANKFLSFHQHRHWIKENL